MKKWSYSQKPQNFNITKNKLKICKIYIKNDKNFTKGHKRKPK